MEAAPALPLSRERFAASGRRLEAFTVGWNLVEAVVGIGSGAAAGSVALVGFGVDSVIESFSGAVLWWRLRAEDHDEERERRASRWVGVSFFLLAAYVLWESAAALARRAAPETSPTGIALAAVSLVVMPLLARAKRRVAAKIGSRALVADSRQTDLCAYLSAILLGGLGLNALFGWWWADPAAALAMTPLIALEGCKAWQQKHCC